MRFVLAPWILLHEYICVCAVDSNPECVNDDDKVNNPNRHVFCVECISLDTSLSWF